MIDNYYRVTDATSESFIARLYREGNKVCQIFELMKAHDGNVTTAAIILVINLYDLINSQGL